MVNPIDGQPPLGLVFFQPKTQMDLAQTGPYIVYQRDQARNKFADNIPYSHTKRYQVTLIAPDVDSPILEKLDQLPMCTFQRHFATANLNHDIYSLFF